MKNSIPFTITIITLFPELIEKYISVGIPARAQANKYIKIRSLDLRKFASDARGTVDDKPYGGGAGMLIMAPVLYKAIIHAKKAYPKRKSKVILLTPGGKKFSQKYAQAYSQQSHIILIAGRYEGFDERITKFVDEQISLGDFVMLGGELAALAIIESTIRLIPNVIGKAQSTVEESFSDGLLEYPQYTKPDVWSVEDKNLRVPKVLLSGNHAKIDAWRNTKANIKTKKIRPDLKRIHDSKKV